MDCNEARPLLQACADGEVGAIDDASLTRHLDGCADCTNALDELRALRRIVRQGIGYQPATPALRARVLAALDDAEAAAGAASARGSATTQTAGSDASARGSATTQTAASDASPTDASRPAAAETPATGASAMGARASVAPARHAPASAGFGGWRRWFTWSPAANAAMAAVTVAAVGVGLASHALRESPTDMTAQAIVASHVRALLSTREIDVASSDRHTVKPWFNGRIDYAPEVRDLAAQGFPLVGGRLDYVDGRRVAVLVYRRNRHPLEVFVLPDPRGNTGERMLQGYAMEGWVAHGMQYWAVTDASGEELRAFVAAWKKLED